MVTRLSFDLETELRGRHWAFEREDGSVIHPDIAFLRSSRIQNLSHDNEHAWDIDGETLVFKNAAGQVTTRFDQIDKTPEGWRFSGAFLGAGASNVRHVLKPGPKITSPRSETPARVCLVVPIHAPYFIYGVNLIVQSLFAEYQLCFVFTSHADRLNFAEMIQDGPAVDYLWIVMEDYVSVEFLYAISVKKSFPTYKKFMAVKELADAFDYIACVDAETFILKDHGWFEACEQIFESKVWHGGRLTPTMGPEHRILHASVCDLAPPEARPQVEAYLSQTRAYTWWWDLPVYKTDGIEAFFQWIGWDDQESIVARLHYGIFDHTCYQYYLALYHGFSIQRVDEIIQCLEFAPATTLKWADAAVGKRDWANHHAYVQDPAYFRDKGYLAVYHLDRKEFPQY